MKDSTVKHNFQVIHFLVQGIHLCIDLTYIEKALFLVALEFVPSSTDYLVGLMNYAGESIPVIDLALRLGLTRQKPYNLDTPLLICFDGQHHVAIVVDEILNMFNVYDQELQMQDDFKQEDSPFLAVIKNVNNLSLLINDKVLFDMNFRLNTRLSKDNALLNVATTNI